LADENSAINLQTSPARARFLVREREAAMVAAMVSQIVRGHPTFRRL